MQHGDEPMAFGRTAFPMDLGYYMFRNVQAFFVGLFGFSELLKREKPFSFGTGPTVLLQNPMAFFYRR